MSTVAVDWTHGPDCDGSIDRAGCDGAGCDRSVGGADNHRWWASSNHCPADSARRWKKSRSGPGGSWAASRSSLADSTVNSWRSDTADSGSAPNAAVSTGNPRCGDTKVNSGIGG